MLGQPNTTLVMPVGEKSMKDDRLHGQYPKLEASIAKGRRSHEWRSTACCDFLEFAIRCRRLNRDGQKEVMG